MDKYFDPIYYGLATVMLVALGYAVFAGLKLHSACSVAPCRMRGLGIALAAVGTVIALIGGLLADALLKDTSYFQQARFASYYVGFALLTFGLDAIRRSSEANHSLPGYPARWRLLSILAWGLFVGPLALAVFYLVNPATFIRNQYGFQVQRIVYWAPMLSTTFTAAVLCFFLALGIKDLAERETLLGPAVFAAFLFVGLLRESLILPDLGDPLTNLLVAFVPFAVGSLCLCWEARSLLHAHLRPA